MISRSTTTAPPDISLPGQVRSFLRAFVARRRRLAWIAAAGWAVFFAIAWLMGICLADRFLHLGRAVRCILLGIDCAGAILLVAPIARRAMTTRIDWIEAAAQIERRTDRFGQRLQTITSQFLAAPPTRGSAPLLDLLLADLDRDLGQTSSHGLVPASPAFRSWLAAGVIFLVFAAIFSIPTLNMPRLLARALQPWSAFPPVTTTVLAVTPGNAEIPQDHDLIVSVRATRLGDEPPLISFTADGRLWRHEPMTAGEGNQFQFDFGPIERDTQYVVAAGDAVSPAYAIHVLRAPAVAPQWAGPQSRPSDRLNIPRHLPDPAGYEEAINAYFEALNKSGVAGGKK